MDLAVEALVATGSEPAQEDRAQVSTGLLQEDRLALVGSSKGGHPSKGEAGGDEDPEFVVDPVKLLVASDHLYQIYLDLELEIPVDRSLEYLVQDSLVVVEFQEA